MNFLLFSGSLRTGSLNKKLIAVVEKILNELPSLTVTVVDLKSLNLPVYDGDIETAGIPDGVKKLGEMMSKADGIIISSPEYNSSIAGSLKNTIDWVSRLRPIPFDQKPVLLMGASPGAFGAIRGLSIARSPLEVLGCFLYPQAFALPKAHEAFQTSGDLVDAEIKKKLTTLVAGYVAFAKKLTAK